MGLELKTSQVQTISQSMIQQVKILQMSAQELTDYMNNMSLENPVAELEEAQPEDKEADRLRKLEWLDRLDEQNRIYYSQEKEESDLSDIMNIGKQEEETLADSLRTQLLGKPYTKRQFEIFDYLADSLNVHGFFTDSTADVALRFGVTEQEVRDCLTIMKQLEPAGVCAESLSDCLYLQLERLEESGEELSAEKVIVRDYLELLGKNQLPAIARQLKLPLERVRRAKEKIQTLNPRPSSGYTNGEELRYIRPDVTVVKLAEYFEIMVNDCSYPELRVNKGYMKMLKSGECDKEVKQYLSEKVRQIEQVQTCISRRNSILTDLAKFLVEEQKDFFLNGKGNLRPLRMKEAAEKLEVHESTISRAVKEKYLQCCWGIFPLDFFFSRGFYADENNETMATDRIKETLREIIQNEDRKKPLSDQKLMEALAAQGIEISRRTVAKYRESMDIPDCRGRKEF